jgi:hypothetical protein
MAYFKNDHKSSNFIWLSSRTFNFLFFFFIYKNLLFGNILCRNDDKIQTI